MAINNAPILVILNAIFYEGYFLYLILCFFTSYIEHLSLYVLTRQLSDVSQIFEIESFQDLSRRIVNLIQILFKYLFQDFPIGSTLTEVIRRMLFEMCAEFHNETC